MLSDIHWELLTLCEQIRNIWGPEQSISFHHCFKTPFLMRLNKQKLRVFCPCLNFKTWSAGLDIFMYRYIWTKFHPENACLLMHYMQNVCNTSKVFPPSVWLGHEWQFHTLQQQLRPLFWNIAHLQIYFQQLLKVSSFGSNWGDLSAHNKEWG